MGKGQIGRWKTTLEATALTPACRCMVQEYGSSAVDVDAKSVIFFLLIKKLMARDRSHKEWNPENC